MKPASLPSVGRCRCGQLRIEVSAPPLLTSACHCRGCQRMSASAYSLTATVPADSFRVTAGEVVRGGAKGPELEHFFCPNCLSWMFTKIVGFEGVVNVRSVMFDDPSWSEPFIETMTRDKLAWASTPARHSYEAFPPMEDLPELMTAFAGR